jgi:antitoxin component YwqK of YwqJK toxin-antitoxin module
MAAIVSECNSDSILEKIGFKEKVTTVIQETDSIVFLPNEDKPFTGKFEMYYSNGQKGRESSYKVGKISGLTTNWKENGKNSQKRNLKMTS